MKYDLHYQNMTVTQSVKEVQMIEKIKKLLTNKYLWSLIIIIIVTIIIYNYISNSTRVIVHDATSTGVSESVVKNILNSENVAHAEITAPQITKKIENIKKENQAPVVNLPPTATEKEIQAAIDNDKGDLAIKEENVNVRPGTNIYSIHLDKSKHGIGIYGAMSYDAGEIKGGYGLHYRNKRWVYQAGVGARGGFDVRIAYEVAQW